MKRACPNCHAPMRSARALVRHLLEEAGERGVTTAQFLDAGCGSRFGARIHELRHDDDLRIEEETIRRGSSVYKLAGALVPVDTGMAAVPDLPSPPAGAAAGQLTVNAIFGWEDAA